MTEARIVLVGDTEIDMAVIEAALADAGITSIMIDFGQASSVELPPIYDWSAMLKRHKVRADEQRAYRQPDYLKHDPTKRHGRR